MTEYIFITDKMALMKLAVAWERFILKDLTTFGRYAKVIYSIRTAPDIRPFLYPVSGRITGLISG